LTCTSRSEPSRGKPEPRNSRGQELPPVESDDSTSSEGNRKDDQMITKKDKCTQSKECRSRPIWVGQVNGLALAFRFSSGVLRKVSRFWNKHEGQHNGIHCILYKTLREDLRSQTSDRCRRFIDLTHGSGKSGDRRESTSEATDRHVRTAIRRDLAHFLVLSLQDI
jgi:hypothetical protein